MTRITKNILPLIGTLVVATILGGIWLPAILAEPQLMGAGLAMLVPLLLASILLLRLLSRTSAAIAKTGSLLPNGAQVRLISRSDRPVDQTVALPAAA